MSDSAPTRDGWTWSGEDAAALPGLTLTILYHPDPRRVGQTASLEASAARPLALSRVSPLFSFEGDAPRALDDPYCSRKPIYLEITGQQLLVRPSHPRIRYRVGDVEGSGIERLPTAVLAHGVLFQLGRRILLELRPGQVAPQPARWRDLVCSGHSMASLRAQIERISASSGCALLIGASGTGKERVAEAIHAASPHAAAPYVAINMAALPATTAAAQLFGYARGAFTGAGAATPGYFERASPGTLLLDEIGAAPPDIQPLLLRALEAQEIQPIGGAPRPHQARVIAATDADLERMVAEGSFSRALWFRLAADTLTIPPLRARRGDLAMQTVAFLTDALGDRSGAHLLTAPEGDARPWMGLDFMLEVLAAPWQGNSRELKAAMRQVADRSFDAPVAALPRTASAPTPASTPLPPLVIREGGDAPRSDDAIEQALVAADYEVRAAARSLGVAPNTVYAAMARLGIPRAGELSEGAILAAQAATGEHTDALARHLRVSRMGLLRRMTALGLK